MVRELMRLFCFEFRVVTVEYFLDFMQEYEITDYLEFIPYLDRNDWERSRYSIYTTVQMNNSKQIAATDIIKFPWDVKEVNDTTSISNSDIERMKEKSKLISNKLRRK